MEINNTNKTKVRYGVHYNERNYEYALHSEKKYFLRNLADVINIVEYCVSQDLKKNGYKVDDKFYNTKLVRFVNDKVDESWEEKEGKAWDVVIKQLTNQILVDNIQRNS